MSRIAVLGMGAMGSRMAVNLLQQGHQVTVWNRSREKVEPLIEKGAIAASTPREAVQGADFAISMVRDDEASRQVWLAEETGAVAGMGERAIAIESSTLTVDWMRQLAQQFTDRNLAFLDAPVAGSRPQAEAAQLIYLVGGESETLEQAMPVLNAMGGAVHHAGTVGSGTAIKLAINTLFGIQAAAMAELISFMNKCGLNKTQAVEILTATPVCSPAAKVLADAMIASKFSPLFPIDLVEKDLSYLMDSAKQAALPMGKTASKVFQQAIDSGYGADNITGVIQLYT